MDLAHERSALEMLRILATTQTRVHRQYEVDSVAIARSRFIYQHQYLGFAEKQKYGGFEIGYEPIVCKPYGATVPQGFLFDLKGELLKC